MESQRDVVIAVSLETARQQLSKALATPLVVQSSNGVLAEIVCSGRIQGNELWVQYVESGRARVYLDLIGHLEEVPGGVQLHMTISGDDTGQYLVYIPGVAMTLFFLSIGIKGGFKTESMVGFWFFLVIGGILTVLMQKLTRSFSQMRIAKLEQVLVQIITGSIPTQPAP